MAVVRHSVVRVLMLLVLVSMAHWVGGQVKQDCATRHGFGAPCIFPYRMNGELYFECTTRFLKGSTDAMCPIKLANPVTREVSRNKRDWGKCHTKCEIMNFRTTEQLHDKMQNLSTQFPDLSSPFVIGASVKNVPLMGIRIGRNVRSGRPSLRPMVRLVANIHGNEAVGRELIVHLAHYLLHAYQYDDRIKQIIDTTDISLVPSLNPDGYKNAKPGTCSGTGKRHGMYNEGDVDLNRDFPTVDDWKRFLTDYDYSVYPGRQPETLAMMQWSADQPFVLSADLHDGAVLVHYPFDFKLSRKSTEPNLTPDNDIFTYLASNYVNKHGTMKNNTQCFRRADGGMANGAEYQARNLKGKSHGSMKDFSYLFTNNLELSIEITCCKFPTRFFILREWENNKESLISYMEQVQMGIKGIVFADGIPVENADIVVWNPDGSRRAKNVTSYHTGEYWRILLPGDRVNTGESTYKIQAFYDDCENTGRKYASLQHKVLLHKKTPLVTKQLFMRSVGFCGISHKSSQTVINQIKEIVTEADSKPTNRESSRRRPSSSNTPQFAPLQDSQDYHDVVEADLSDELFFLENQQDQTSFYADYE